MERAKTFFFFRTCVCHEWILSRRMVPMYPSSFGTSCLWHGMRTATYYTSTSNILPFLSLPRMKDCCLLQRPTDFLCENLTPIEVPVWTNTPFLIRQCFGVLTGLNNNKRGFSWVTRVEAACFLNELPCWLQFWNLTSNLLSWHLTNFGFANMSTDTCRTPALVITHKVASAILAINSLPYWKNSNLCIFR